MKKISDIFIIVCTSIILLCVSISFLVTKPEKISLVEGRKLQQYYNFNVSSYLDTTYQKKLENYLSDQFYNRDFIIRNILRFERIFLNKKIINNIFIGENNVLLFKPGTPLNKTFYNDKVNDISSFNSKLVSNGIDLIYALPPHQKVYYKDSYPYDLSDRSIEGTRYFVESLKDKGVNTIYMYDDFIEYRNQISEDLYYKVDHHWNHEGFFLGYKLILENLRINNVDIYDQKVEWNKVCNPNKAFIGSISRQIHNSIRGNELFCNYVPLNGYNDFDFYLEGKLTKPNYDNIHTDYPSEYWHVFNGDGKILYDFKQSNYPNLLIIKDSYANPITIMLAQHFNRTYVYDYRYETKDISEYIEEEEIDVILILTHDNNLSNQLFSTLNNYK